MKKYTKLAISIVIALTFFMRGTSIYAATFNFDPTSTSVKPNNTFQVAVNVDAGTDQIAGTDIYLTYDATVLEVQTVTDGAYFPQVEDVPSSGRLYISGFVNTQGDYKTGAGTVATVTFKALQEGSTNLEIDCDTAQTDTSKIVQNDTAVTNILECSTLQLHPVTIASDAAESTNTSSTGETTTTTSTVSELPQSGVVEDMFLFAVWGAVLVGIGATIRILLRII